MIKSFKYKGYDFLIEVVLDSEVQKCPNGKRLHMVTIQSTANGNFCITPSKTMHKVQLCDTHNLESVIKGFEEEAMVLVDGTEK